MLVVPAIVIAGSGFARAFERPGLALDASIERLTEALGLTPSQGLALFRLYPTIAICLIGLVVVWLRSDDWMVLFASVFYIVGGTTLTGPLHLLYTASPWWRFPVRILWAVGFLSSVMALCVFPDGHPYPRWTRRLAVAGAIFAFLPGVPEFFLRFPDVSETPAAWAAFCFGGVGTLWITGYVAQGLRYRRASDAVQRRHIRWVVGSIGLAFLFGFPTFVGLGRPGPLPAWVPWTAAASFVPLLVFQLSLAVAILRGQLYDIEAVLSRTLVYAALSVLLVAIYAVTVFVLGIALHAIAGSSDLAVAGSTLAVAAAFRPARRRIQANVDRRFNRSRYDAARTIEAFGARLRDEIDVSTLSDEITSVVTQTVQPSSVSLWLRPKE